MAQEKKRGCGYRRVGGMYLCGEYAFVPCDRLPYPLHTCPVCDGGIKVSRGFTKINPYALFGIHKGCNDTNPDCYMCLPSSNPAYIMGVGEQFYTTQSFMEEAKELGVSKRIPWIPKELELGKTVIYLAHPKACLMKVQLSQTVMTLVPKGEPAQPPLVYAEEVKPLMGIFTVFVPQRIEKLVWESEATPEVVDDLKERGITPVTIKDGDPDHDA